MADYDNIPHNAPLRPARFRVAIPDNQIKDFKKLLQLSRVGPETFENADRSRKYGINRQWIIEAKEYWEKKFDWRATERDINAFTQYEVAIKDDDGESYAIHFTGLFSRHPEAIPVVVLHGWPGSFLEFIPVLKQFTAKYTPDDLPYHIIVPSLPGYAFSTGPPRGKEWKVQDMARIINKLMVGLGFEDGYVAQGGDIGSMISRVLAAVHEPCKAMHLNFCIMPQPEGATQSEVSEQEMIGLARAQDFSNLGNAYAREHGTRPATIGMVLDTNPLALLIWVGEKFLEWTDRDPPLESILASVTLYWLTSTFPRSIFPYVQFFGADSLTAAPGTGAIHADPKYHCNKPMGYSWFPKELAPIPVNWVKTTGNLVWYNIHQDGGHFAAMEKPDAFMQDLEAFINELK